jgi:HAD superfamily hydrolase (TIGR01456 family)
LFSYGFKNVVTPGDVLIEYPAVWPFSHPFVDYYKSFARPLPKPIDADHPSKSLKIDAIFVYNDPRDWGLDATIITDLLLSREGIFGTLSSKNDDPNLPNRGYQQDGQPPLYYSNPDLWWAAKFHLPRLGQGAFRESLEGLWTAITGGEKAGVTMNKTVIGKPYQMTYEFAEKKLLAHRQDLFGSPDLPKLKRVYMIGDNPESDIRGGNTFKSPLGMKWSTIMVKTGVYVDGIPAHQPTSIAKNVYEAVRWAMNEESGYRRE